MAKRKEFIRYTPQQLEDLRNTDMIDFLERRRGLSFRRESGTYRCIEHNSLVISSDRKRWYWNSHAVGGNNVIDWFNSIEDIGFQECCRIMIGGKAGYEPVQYAKSIKKPPEKKPFKEPEHEGSRYSRVYMYLTKTRCIAPNIVKRLFDEKKLYQEAKYGNCVFCEYDKNGVMKFAERRATTTYKRYDENGKEIKFRPTVEGADYTYGFHIDADKNAVANSVFIFEAPIDLLSHATLTNIKARNREAYRSQNRLSLSGLSDIALEAYLKEHPHVKTLIWCLDNDYWGQRDTGKFIKKYDELGYTSLSAPVSFGKDYNELLCEVTRRMQASKSAVKADTQSSSQAVVGSDCSEVYNNNNHMRR